MARFFFRSSAVSIHDSQAYRTMDVTRERIRRIIELRGKLGWGVQTLGGERV